MSFYDDASIVMIPSGYKTSKLYSQKPTDGAGDLSFTRTGSTATRVNESGLIEMCRTNLFAMSEVFENAYWSKTATSIDLNAAVSPINTLTADKIIATAVSGNHFVARSMGTQTGIFTFSLYVKSSEYNFIRFQDVNAGRFNVVFNLSLGIVLSGSGGAIVNVGNGWYRCSVAYDGNSASVNIGFIGIPTATTTINHTGDGVSGVFVWGAQLETGDIATDYIPTTSAAVTVGPIANLPRLDYTGGGCPKLLMEPTRTNLALYSQHLNNAYWTISNATVTSNNTTSPDGYINADLLTLTSTIGVFTRLNLIPSAATYTFSAFFKKNTANIAALQIYDNSAGTSAITKLDLTTLSITQSGLTSKASFQDYGNGWYRLIMTYTSTSAATVYLRAEGTSGQSLWIYGAQLELGPHATSYIPTFNASVTRNADICSKTGISSLIGQTEGTLFADFNYNQPSSDSNGRLLQIYGIGESVNSILPLIESISGFENMFQITVFISGVPIFPIPASVATIVPFGRQKFAIAYSDGVYTVYRNGSLFASGTGGVPSSLSEVSLGSSPSLARSISNPINQAILFKTRLSNADLATLTTL